MKTDILKEIPPYNAEQIGLVKDFILHLMDTTNVTEEEEEARGEELSDLISQAFELPIENEYFRKHYKNSEQYMNCVMRKAVTEMHQAWVNQSQNHLAHKPLDTTIKIPE